MIGRSLIATSLAYRGASQAEPVGDGSYELGSNVLGAGSRGWTHYALGSPWTRTSQRAAGGQRASHLYDGRGSVVGLTDGAGAPLRSYSYDPHGHVHPEGPSGNENPFGHLGSYGAGADDWGVTCSAPNLVGGRYYDAEDGRLTQRGGGSEGAAKGKRIGRRGAFGDAKRRMGLPRTQQPTSVGPAYNEAGNVIPGGRTYRFGDGPDAPYITNHPPTRYPDGGYRPGHFHPNAPGGNPHIYYGD